MATDSALRSVTNTLSGTTADAITLTQLWPAVEITNHDASEKLYGRMDGTTAVAAADGTFCVLPGNTKVVRAIPTVNTSTIVTSLVGNGNIYTVEGVQ